MIRVSLIIPIYNVAPYIGACLDSVYKQIYDNIEVVLVNDCTPDNSFEVAQPHINKLQSRFQVQIIQHDKNRGLSAARNSGVEHATGKYIYFLDSDDELSSDCVSLLVRKAIEHRDIYFVIGEVYAIGGNNKYPLLTSELLTDNVAIATDYIKGCWYAMAVN